jgi:hypothetical protein
VKIKKLNTNKLGTLLVILLIAGLTTHISTTLASDGNGLNQGEQTGATDSSTNSSNNPDSNQTVDASLSAPYTSENAKQYNKTDVTPKGEIQQIGAQEQTIFRYRNMTMTMNCTQNCTLSFTADEEVTPKEFGLTVDPNQTMTLAMNLTKSPLNGAMVNERCLNFYLGIEPDAVLELQAQIRLRMNQTELNQNMNREINASSLTWMYWNQTQMQWEKVESYMDQNGYLVCNTNHFSTWTVAEIVSEEQTPTQQDDYNGLPLAILFALPVVAIVFVIVSAIIYKKRH